MARKSIIKTEIERAEAIGFKLYKQGSGKISYKNGSKLNQAWDNCRAEHPKSEMVTLVGGRKQHLTQGSDWAVVYSV